MGDFIWKEIDIFIQSAYYGILLGLSYDVLRILRRILKHKNIVVYIEDYIFWVIWGIMIFALLFSQNDGIVRGYVFVAIVIGGFLYLKAFSHFLVKYISLVLNKILTLVLKKPLKAVKMVLVKVFAHIKKCVQKGIKKVHGKKSIKEKRKKPKKSKKKRE